MNCSQNDCLNRQYLDNAQQLLSVVHMTFAPSSRHFSSYVTFFIFASIALISFRMAIILSLACFAEWAASSASFYESNGVVKFDAIVNISLMVKFPYLFLTLRQSALFNQFRLLVVVR